MPTVAGNYKIAVKAIRPDAQMQYVSRDGVRCFRIVDRGEILVDAEYSHESAWRAAEWQLHCDMSQ